MSAPPPKPRRRWFAFSLRTLLALVTLAALCCGAFVVYVKPYWDEQQKWERLKAIIDEQKPEPNGLISSNAFLFSINGLQKPPRATFAQDEAVPEWLRRWCSEDRFRVIQAVDTEPWVWKDEVVGSLAQLKHLQWVDLSRSPVTDEGLRRFAGHPRLEFLNLSQTKITDAGLSSLHGCVRLRTLDLRHTTCTFEGILALRDLPLEIVYVDFPLTEAMLRAGGPVRAITSSEPIVLERVSELGLSNLESMLYWGRQGSGNIVGLELRDSDLTPAGLEAVFSLPIRHLTVQNCRMPPAEQVRLMRKQDRSFTVFADRASLPWETVADTFLTDARAIKLGPRSVRLPEAQVIYTADLSAEVWRAMFERVPFAALEKLEVDFTPSSDFVRRLATRPRLAHFECEAEGPADLTALAEAPALETLVVYHRSQPSAFWRFLRELPRLRELRLRKLNGADDLGASTTREIAAASGLTKLSLAYSGIDDEALQELAALSHLRELDLRGVERVTDEGLQELQRRLPELEIRRD